MFACSAQAVQSVQRNLQEFRTLTRPWPSGDQYLCKTQACCQGSTPGLGFAPCPLWALLLWLQCCSRGFCSPAVRLSRVLLFVAVHFVAALLCETGCVACVWCSLDYIRCGYTPRMHLHTCRLCVGVWWSLCQPRSKQFDAFA